MHRQMADVMKMMGGGKGKGMAGALGKMFGIGGGMGGMPQPTPEQIEALQKQMGGKLPDFPGGAGGAAGPCRRGGGPGLPGLGGRRSPASRGSAASRSEEEEVSFPSSRADPGRQQGSIDRTLKGDHRCP